MLNEEYLKSIAHNRTALLQQHGLRDSHPSALAPFLPLLQALNSNKISYELEYVFCTQDPDLFRQWQESLEQPQYTELGLNASAVKQEPFLYIHRLVQQLYPTISGDTYRPALTYFKETVPPGREAELLNNILRFLDLQDEAVYLFSSGAPPVLSLAAADLAQQAAVLQQLMGDCCILPLNGQKMIFRSAGHEWSWGAHYPYTDLYRTDTPRYYVYWTTSGTPEMDDIFTAAAPAMGASFSYNDLLTAEDRFLDSGADTGTYIIRGTQLWIEVLFEKHESYYGWHCYTYRRELVEEWKAYFNQLKRAAKGN